MTLYRLCEHGLMAHRLPSGCPGGRVATIEDLIEALGGEKVWWCKEHRSEMGPALLRCRVANLLEFHGRQLDPCRMVERILIPALDQEKET